MICRLSFVVNPGTRLFHCFGCGIGGDAIRLVELHEKFSFRDAIGILSSNTKDAVKGKRHALFRLRIPVSLRRIPLLTARSSEG